MLSGTATRAVLGPPIRPQPLPNRSPAATAAATGIDRPDMLANSRTAHHVSCPHAPSAAIVCGRWHRQRPERADPLLVVRPGCAEHDLVPGGDRGAPRPASRGLPGRPLPRHGHGGRALLLVRG